jgi:serine/threonine-protein kinase
MVQRFLWEARATNTIHHPNIVDIYDFGELADGRPFYIMEILEGVNLQQHLRAHGSFSPAEVFELVEPLGAALQAAHDAGVVHRDLKASNVMVVNHDGKMLVKLLDFGIAKLSRPDGESSGLTSVSRRLGTPHSMAPEQINGGKIDARTDVYAFGVLLYQLLTGQHPFVAKDPIEIERMHLTTPPPRPSRVADVPPSIDAIVLKCLEKQADRRHQTARALIDAFRSAIRSQTQPRARVLPALGIFVEARVATEAEEDLDDIVLDNLAAVFDVAAARLQDAGFAIPLRTSNALLATSVLTSGAPPADTLDERRRAVDVCLRLHDELVAGGRVGGPIQVAIMVHVDRILVGEDPNRPVGGPLMQIASWASGGPDGVSASDAALDGLDGPKVARLQIRPA